ncbi:MAG: HlyD family type I secretion periplasmic adaptor subunit [Arcobacter sp.]|nr:HlyD family type I secretion periplasmic adaptor subunit [Arcobacter sp.]
MNKKDIEFVNSLYGQANEKPPLKLDILFITIIVFFLTAILWATFAEIDELTRGNGKVIPANKIQAIQNLDGGIVSEILVQEGSEVKIDQALMKIDTIRFQASLEENKEMYFSLLAKRTRLTAELKFNSRNRTPKLKFDEKIKKNNSNYASIETRLFKNRINEYKSSIKTLQYQLYQKRQELKEAYAKEKQLRKSLKNISKQRTTISRLVRTGSKSNIELLKTEASYDKTKADLENTLLSIPKAKLAIAEAKSKIQERTNGFKTEASTSLQEVESEIKRIKSRLVSDKDKLSKTIVRSPVNGIVKQLNINTIGGVVKSGDTLIEIVPNSDILLVEAKIDPKDIAFINPTQKVIVKLTAYDFSIYGALEGKIVEISADSIKDKESKEGKSYYKVVVKTNKNYLERNNEKLPIIPGMIASIDIVTGKKSIMNFILKPILKTKQGALHER